MSEDFDPYYKWLGIGPEEQPANYYRLLSIRLFESDPDVIASGADRQMGHVRSFHSGPHAALSQKLLNELAAARICLLNAERKAAYDETLRAARQSAGASASFIAQRPEDTASIDAGLADAIASAARVATTRPHPRASSARASSPPSG